MCNQKHNCRTTPQTHQQSHNTKALIFYIECIEKLALVRNLDIKYHFLAIDGIAVDESQLSQIPVALY
jgi:hypothetical protein